MADFSKITDVNGNQHTVKDSTARTGSGTSFDNTGTGLNATNVQGAITELNSNLSQKANASDVATALANQKYFYIDSEGYGCINYDLFQTV